MTQLELRRHLVELAQSIQDHHLIEIGFGLGAFLSDGGRELPQHIFAGFKAGLLLRTGGSAGLMAGPCEFLQNGLLIFPGGNAQVSSDDARVINTLENLTPSRRSGAGGEKMFVHVLKTPLYAALGRSWHAGDFLGRDEPEENEEALAYDGIYCGRSWTNILTAFISRGRIRSSGAATQWPSPGCVWRCDWQERF